MTVDQSKRPSLCWLTAITAIWCFLMNKSATTSPLQCKSLDAHTKSRSALRPLPTWPMCCLNKRRWEDLFTKQGRWFKRLCCYWALGSSMGHGREACLCEDLHQVMVLLWHCKDHHTSLQTVPSAISSPRVAHVSRPGTSKPKHEDPRQTHRVWFQFHYIYRSKMQMQKASTL